MRSLIAATTVAVTLVSMSGCTGNRKIEYDPIKDQSKVWIRVAMPRLTDQKEVDSSLYLSLTGTGKRPAKWTGL